MGLLTFFYELVDGAIDCFNHISFCIMRFSKLYSVNLVLELKVVLICSYHVEHLLRVFTEGHQ